MTSRPDRIPFARSDAAVAPSRSKSFWRGITANVLDTLANEGNPAAIIDRAWPGDESAKAISRAVKLPATTTSAEAQPLVPIAITDLLPTLAPAAAATRLYQNAVQLDFGTANIMLVPKITTMPTGTWIAEGSATDMVQPVLGSVTIGPPRKLLFGAAATSEIQRYTMETATTVIQRTVVDAAQLAVDAALLDTTAGDTTRPTGLLNGVSDLGATAGGGLAAIVADLAKIAGAFATAKISAEGLMLFVPDALAIKIRALLPPTFAAAYQIVGTPAVADSTMVAVAPQAVAMYIATPQIEVSSEALVHMATDAHDNIDTNAVAETVKSAWQSDLLVLKVRLRCCWGKLAAGAVQLISSVSW
jgi:hypothetical protein